MISSTPCPSRACGASSGSLARAAIGATAIAPANSQPWSFMERLLTDGGEARRVPSDTRHAPFQIDRFGTLRIERLGRGDDHEQRRVTAPHAHEVSLGTIDGERLDGIVGRL